MTHRQRTALHFGLGGLIIAAGLAGALLFSCHVVPNPIPPRPIATVSAVPSSRPSIRPVPPTAPPTFAPAPTPPADLAGKG